MMKKTGKEVLYLQAKGKNNHVVISRKFSIRLHSWNIKPMDMLMFGTELSLSGMTKVMPPKQEEHQNSSEHKSIFYHLTLIKKTEPKGTTLLTEL